MAVISVSGAQSAAQQVADGHSASATGVDPKTVAVYRSAGRAAGVPWQVVAALGEAQKTQSGGDGLGPFRIRSDAPGLDTARADDLTYSARLVANLLARSLAGQPGFRGVSSLTSDAKLSASGTWTAKTDSTSTSFAAARRTTFVAALVALPVQNNSDPFMGRVYDQSLRWTLGQGSTGCGSDRSGGVISGVAYTGSPVEGLNAAQTANAWAIMQAARSRGLDARAAAIGVSVSLGEATLMNYANDGSSTLTDGSLHRQLTDAERSVARQSMDYPHDAVGRNLDSIGLFQQRPMTGWGDPAELIDPVRSAGKFFDALVKVDGWQNMTPWTAGQTVQGSPDHTGGIYEVRYHQAEAIVATLNSQVGGGVTITPAAATTATAPADAPTESAVPTSALPPASAGAPPNTAPPSAGVAMVGASIPGCGRPTGSSGGTVTANGPEITLPDNEFVDPAVRGKTIRTANAEIATGLAAGLSQLGLPYVWGGGGDGAPANNGCGRGGGQLNSCGSEIGFDCSGLTAFTLVSGGFISPGSSSGEQRSGGASVAYSDGLPGDIAGFPGHVAVYLGVIDGTGYILEASTVGVPVHVVPLTRNDRDPELHRYWD